MDTKQALAGPATFFVLLFTLQGSVTAADGEGEARVQDDPEDPATPQTCVQMQRIDHTRIIDDSNILFYMRGKTIYHNQLPYRCAGLKIAGTFMYRTSLNSLCNVDVITVLRQSGGGFSPGPSCGLGIFTPVTAEEAELLKSRKVDPIPESGDPEIEEIE